MKRELAGGQSQLASSFGRSCDEDLLSPSSEEVSENGSCKRFRVAKVNGFIVYSRLKKSSSSRKASECERIRDDLQTKKMRSLEEIQLGISNGINTPIDGSLVAVEILNKESSVELGGYKHEQVTDRKLILPKEEGKGSIEFKNSKLRRFTRSNLNFKVETVEVKVNGLEDVDSKSTTKVEVETIAEGSALTPPKKNLELKMSKKIALGNVPMTVKELFETGFLEGVPVVYMGGKKFQEFCLRGVIKDVGILCSCAYCKGCRVIPPSQFEIHAINQYRRAAQYICFENGKSLLDVLNACRSSPLDSLEATIQSAISGSPIERTFTCKRCKGTFPTIYVGKIGPLCNSCVESKESNGSLSSETSIKSSLVEPVLSAPSGSAVKKIARKPSKPDKLSRSAPARMSSRKIIERKTMKLPKSELISKLFKSTSAHLSSQKRKQLKVTPRTSKPATLSMSFKSASADASLENKCQWKMTKKDQRLHKLVFEEDGLPDGAELAYYARGKKLLVGYKRGFGILCGCCKCEVSPSTFEAHAGWATRKKPYAYIYTSNGVSLHELAISLSKGRRYSAKDNDDLCIVCADGGSLILCDGCPRAFHKECAYLPSVPRGKWFCQFCENMFQREKFVEHNVNAVAAGRVLGVDPIEEITKRCIRIVKNIEAELSGCALCRGYDFSRSGFGPRTIILCDQCEKEFHVGCLRSHKIANLKELPKGPWFCCSDCGRINSTLQKLIVHGAEKLPDPLLNVIKKKNTEKGLETINFIDVRWRLLSGKVTSPETEVLLSQALGIFQECFDPIVDTSGRDLIPLMVQGKNSKGQDYGGMYCAVLTVNSLVVSAGVLRIFGQEVAELPLVATSNGNHGKGYFQLLFSCIEKLLSFLNVQCLVLPSAEEAESIWIDKFGFQRIKPDQLSKYRKSCCQMLNFKGTSMLQKVVPACRIVNHDTEFVELL